MKFEYLASGAADCPLLRIYAFDAQEASQLREVFRRLADGSVSEFHLDDIAQSVGGCTLVMGKGARDEGVVNIGANAFQWALTEEGWSQVADLVEPFCERSEAGSYQWLWNGQDIQVLLSPDGHW